MTKSDVSAASKEEQPEGKRRRPSLATMILIGLILGVACGLFFGEYCAQLSVLGDAFIGLLRMTVLPYIIVSIVANLGRLSLRDSRKLAKVGGLVMLVLWSLGLLAVFALPHCFPEWKASSFFSSPDAEAAERPDDRRSSGA